MRLRSAIATARLAWCLADDVLVELGDDLPRRQRLDGGGGRFGKVDGHAELVLRATSIVDASFV